MSGDKAPAAGKAGGDSYGRPLPFGFQRLTAALNALGTLWILVLMVLMNADVIGRNLLSAPLRGVTEIVSMSIVGIVFLQLADTLHRGRLTRADVLLDRLKRGRPRLANGLQALYHFVGMLLLATICWASWEPLQEALRIGEYVGAVGDFQAPMWPVRLIVVTGSACTALAFLFLAWADLRAALRNPA
ncbi:MAG: TRAP transporter small permease [Rhodocyclaceae bacterium]|nr:TRAP transporter small permease [Rhodocyclaceae bacterium]